ncbi:MAG: C1 family peptidase [Olegusella sp.]|nr:C1 family peptidase [Olegusella sp.]
MSDNKAIDVAWSDSQYTDFVKKRGNRVARNAVAAMGVNKAAVDPTRMRTYHDTYSVSRKRTGQVTNQRQSGRCWMFSAFNVLRASTMETLDVDSFEFSQAYGMFYDKLEKANMALERIIAMIDRPFDDRELSFVLEHGMGDGGFYPFAMNLVLKWGVVPRDAMPDTASAKASAQMNVQLQRLIHRDACELKRLHEAGKDTGDLRAAKVGMLRDIWRVLAICLGEPPRTFDLEVAVGPDAQVPEKLLIAQEGAPKKAQTAKKDKDKKGADEKDKPQRILRDCGITPLEFLERYVRVDPADYVELVSIPSERYPFGQVYHPLLTDSVMGGRPIHMVNVEPEVLDAAAVASLRAGVPCEMACDVSKEFPRGDETFGGVLATDTMDFDSLLGTDLAMSREDMYASFESSLTHAMTFQGVELDGEGAPVAWRVENSWGKDACKDGYLIVSSDWFHLYGGEVVCRREFVPADVLALSEEGTAVDVEPWSGFGCAVGAARRA